MIRYTIYFFLLCALTSVNAETSPDIKSTQNAFNGLSSLLSVAEPEVFGGMYFQNEPEFKVKLLITDLSKKDRLLDYVNAKVKNKINQYQLSTIIDIVEVDYSYAELQAIREQYEMELKNKGIRYDSYTSVKENKLIFRIISDKQNEEIGRGVLALSEKANSVIELQPMSKLSESYARSYGGYPLNNSMGSLQCTIGFNSAPNLFNENPGMITAAHCKGEGPRSNKMYSHDGVEYTLSQPDSAGPEDDVQTAWHKWGTDISFRSNRIKTCSEGCLHPITSVEEYLEIGYEVCKYGERTGRTCGTITATDFAPVGYIPDADPVYSLVARNDGSPMGAPGDSGGPVYSGNVGHGILSGGVQDTGEGIISRGIKLQIRLVSGD
jgi:hypothetical protein